MASSVEAVLWDFGGVFLPSPFTHIRSFADELGVPGHELERLVFGSYDSDGDHPWHRLERGELSFDECNTELMAAAAAEGVAVDPIELLMRMGDGGTRILRDEVVAVAQRIRADGYRTAIITNNIREFRDGWRALVDVDTISELVIDSSEVGIRKPDPAIYRLALERLGGIEPERSVFLDDAPGNVRAAEDLGMHAILVGDDPAPALAELEEVLGG